MCDFQEGCPGLSFGLITTKNLRYEISYVSLSACYGPVATAVRHVGGRSVVWSCSWTVRGRIVWISRCFLRNVVKTVCFIQSLKVGTIILTENVTHYIVMPVGGRWLRKRLRGKREMKKKIVYQLKFFCARWENVAITLFQWLSSISSIVLGINHFEIRWSNTSKASRRESACVPKVPWFPKGHLLFGRFPGFAPLSFW
jgi:hypothetical protein